MIAYDCNEIYARACAHTYSCSLKPYPPPHTHTHTRKHTPTRTNLQVRLYEDVLRSNLDLAHRAHAFDKTYASFVRQVAEARHERAAGDAQVGFFCVHLLILVWVWAWVCMWVWVWV